MFDVIVISIICHLCSVRASSKQVREAAGADVALLLELRRGGSLVTVNKAICSL